jgi:hypothetical protein
MVKVPQFAAAIAHAAAPEAPANLSLHRQTQQLIENKESSQVPEPKNYPRITPNNRENRPFPGKNGPTKPEPEPIYTRKPRPTSAPVTIKSKLAILRNVKLRELLNIPGVITSYRIMEIQE